MHQSKEKSENVGLWHGGKKQTNGSGSLNGHKLYPKRYILNLHKSSTKCPNSIGSYFS